MNTEAMGICHLKKGMCTENVKNACSRTLCCQDYNSSFFLLLCLPWGTVWEQRCLCKHFAPQFVTWPCFWVKNTLLCRSPEITHNSSKVKGKIVQIQCKQHSSRRKGRGTVCKLPHPFSQKGLSPTSSQPAEAFPGVHSLGILDLFAFNTLGRML